MSTINYVLLNLIAFLIFIYYYLTMAKQLKIQKRKRGRPPGSTTSSKRKLPPAIMETLRDEITSMLSMLNDRGLPLHVLLCNEIEATGRPSVVLSALSKYMPTDINLNVQNDFTAALKEVSERLQSDVIDLDIDND